MGERLIAITIARQLGAGGAPLGKRLAARLGFTYLDDEILRRAAEKMGANPADLARWDEHRARFWERLSQSFALGAPEGIYTPMDSLGSAAVVNDRQVFQIQAEVIRETAARENCIVIGRAGFWILKDHPGRLSLYLHAPAECRVPAVMDAFKVDAARARQLIQRIDADRAHFVRDVTGTDISPLTHHLSADTSKVSLDTLEEMVADIVEKCRAC